VSELPVGVLPEVGIGLRRARAEASGEVYDLQFTFQLEAGRSVLQNTAGTAGTLNCTQGQGGALTCTDRQAAVQGTEFRAALINGYANYRVAPMLNVQAGQFRIPFGLENRTSINFMPFHDRALAVRMASGTTGRELGAMVWGDTPENLVSWAIGAFSGDGSDRPNVDGNFDFMGRTVTRPLRRSKALRDVQLGFSARGGSRSPKKSAYDLNALTTQSGFAFFQPTYTDGAKQRVHILPSDLQRAVALELYVPYGKVELAAEYIYMQNDTREAAEGRQLAPGGTARAGRLEGGGFYAWLGYWLVGGREIIPTPGNMAPTRVDFKKAPKATPTHGLQVIARYEQVRLRYRAALRGGVEDASTPSGSIGVDAVGLAMNAWLTKHVRLSLNYNLYTFPDAKPLTPSQPGGPVSTSSQRARGPAQSLAAGVNSAARDGAEAFHEVSVRLGAQF
jgi:phosphate-selective porin